MKLKLNLGMTIVLLVAIALSGAGYMAFGVLHMGSIKKTTRITLLLTRSGGLLPTSDVTMRGIRVGRVTDVQTTAAGLTVSLEVDSGQHVPTNSAVAVLALSAAGEQYIDFKPRTIAPPYFVDGAVIPADQVTNYASVSETLAQASALFSSFNLKDLEVIVKNLGEILNGSGAMFDQLAADAAVYAKLIRENKQIVSMLFGNIDFLATNFGKLDVGGLLTDAGRQLAPDRTGTDYRITQELQKLYDHITHGDYFAVGGGIETLIAKLGEYFDILAGPMGTFAPVLEAATEPMRGDDVDVGRWIGFWGSALDEKGGVRVRVHVEGQSPDREENPHDQVENPQDQEGN